VTCTRHGLTLSVLVTGADGAGLGSAHRAFSATTSSASARASAVGRSVTGVMAMTHFTNGPEEIRRAAGRCPDRTQRIEPFARPRRTDCGALLTEAERLCAFVASQADYYVVHGKPRPLPGAARAPVSARRSDVPLGQRRERNRDLFAHLLPGYRPRSAFSVRHGPASPSRRERLQ
jgi:hypothetical protein